MQPHVPASGLPFPSTPEIIFTNWREALHRSGLTPGMQAVYTLAVSGYLGFIRKVCALRGSCSRKSGTRNGPAQSGALRACLKMPV
ncbi:MAG TPA: hypothetical protein P5205_03605 [Candidatus Paceibacterota bacterium]|nr:hypothetical protein [Verrucomicrobiota bacterium]HSA09435.1 hypothetical protein [Candidatus Paceibacterota bacterium]